MSVDLSTMTEEELVELLHAAQQALAARQAQQAQNAAQLREVDEKIGYLVGTVATRLQQITSVDFAASPEHITTALHWLADAVWHVGDLTIQSARLAAGRTDTVETMPSSGAGGA